MKIGSLIYCLCQLFLFWLLPQPHYLAMLFGTTCRQWLLMQVEKCALSIHTDTYPTLRKWKWGKYGEIDIFSVYMWLFGWISLTQGILRDGNWSFHFLHSGSFGFGHRCFNAEWASQEILTSFCGNSCGNICGIISRLYKILAPLTCLIASDSVKDNQGCLSLYHGSWVSEALHFINSLPDKLGCSVIFNIFCHYLRWLQ